MINKKTIEIYEIGTKTKLNGDIESEITGISVLKGGLIKYELMWWNNGSTSFSWFYESGFTINENIKNKIKY